MAIVIELLEAKKNLIRHTSKAEETYGLKKIEEKDMQFLIEKLIYSIKKKNLYMITIEKKTEIILEVTNNYRICRTVYQSLFADIADTFIQHIHSLLT